MFGVEDRRTVLTAAKGVDVGPNGYRLHAMHGVSSRTSDELRLPFEKTFPSHCAWESKLYFCVICVQFRPPCKVFANFFKTLKKNRKKVAGY
jgi:hypothetical protein